MDYILFTLAMIDHELAERALQECRSDIEDRDEERPQSSVRAKPSRSGEATSAEAKPRRLARWWSFARGKKCSSKLADT